MTPSNVETLGTCYWETSGMYGIGEYVQYRGYSVSSLYNRYIDEQTSGTGFTYTNFKNEIDNGRPVLLHVVGHTMLAYGYSDPGTIYIRDTWTASDHTMTWNGKYDGRQHMAMTCFTPSGGSATPDDIIPNVAPLLIILMGT